MKKYTSRSLTTSSFLFVGKWPFWLSPRQAMVVPVAPPFNDYAEEVKTRLRAAGFCCDTDTDDSNTMNKKVRNAQLSQYNFIFGESVENFDLSASALTPWRPMHVLRPRV